MVFLLVSTCLLICGFCDVAALFDPCNSVINLPAVELRGPNHTASGDRSLCDRYLPHDEAWYVPKDSSGRYYDLANECRAWGQCSTTYPIYLKGEIPTVEDGVTDMLACQIGNNGCGSCYADVKIKVKNCGRYRVYLLPKATGCPQGYCFDPTNVVDPPVATTPQPEVDPCDTTLPLPALTDRSSSKSSSEGMTLCDRYLPHDREWYLPQGEDGRFYDMATQCVPLSRCSTTYPVYIKGLLPRMEDGIVAMIACQVGREGACGTCFELLDIKVKNCGSYRVYNLPKTTGCPHGYCFDPVEGSEPRTTATPKTTTSAPGGGSHDNDGTDHDNTDDTDDERDKSGEERDHGDDKRREKDKGDGHDHDGRKGVFRSQHRKEMYIIIGICAVLLFGCVLFVLAIILLKRRNHCAVNTEHVTTEPPSYEAAIKDDKPKIPEYDFIVPQPKLGFVNSVFQISANDVYHEISEEKKRVEEPGETDNTLNQCTEDQVVDKADNSSTADGDRGDKEEQI